MAFGPVNNLIQSSDYWLDVAQGNVTGQTAVSIIGENKNIDTTEQDVWGPGGTIVLPTSGEQWEVVFSNANDTALGTGARAVTVFYLDDNHIQQSEVLASNGGTVAMTAIDAFRLEEFVVTDSGTNKTNAGDITLQVVGGGNVRALILANGGLSHQAIWTIPANKTGFLLSIGGAVTKGKDVEFTIRTTDFITNTEIIILRAKLYQQTILEELAMPQKLNEKTDVRVTATSSNANTTATALYGLVYIDD